MKKNKILGVLLAFSLLTATFGFMACDNDDSVVNPPQETNSQNGDGEGEPEEPEEDKIPDGAVQTYLEGQKDINAANLYSTNLNNSPTVLLNDEQVAEARIAGKLEGIEIDETSIPSNKKVIYKKKTATCGIEDLAYWGANSNTTYAGALLKIDQTGTEQSPMIGLKRKPMTLSIGLEGATGVDYQSKTVETVTQSSVGQAINDLVKGFTTSEAQLPYVVAMQLTEIKAKEELNAALGLSLNVDGFFNFSTEFDFQNKQEQTYAVLTLKQIYYTVNVDYNAEEGAFSLLDDSVTFEEAKKACPQQYAPVYVSSVSYGRLAAITLKTSESFKDLAAKLNIGGGAFIVDGELEGQLQSVNTISDLQMNCFIYGGAVEGNQSVLTAKTIDGMLEALNQPYDPAKQVGLPISYQLSYIADNSSAKIGFAGEYYYAELIDDNGPTEGKTVSVNATFPETKTVIDGDDEYGYKGAWYLANHEYLIVDISNLDLKYIEYQGKNIEVKIELTIWEKDDGYQQIFLYNPGVSPSLANESEQYIAGTEIEHNTGTADATPRKYIVKAVLNPEVFESDKLWIAFDSYGNDNDTWYFKDVTVTLSATDSPVKAMYATV